MTGEVTWLRSKRVAIAFAAAALVAAAVLAPLRVGAHHLATVGLALESVAEISSGWMHTCARTNEGGVLCWGNNATGQLGDGTFATARPVPKRLNGFDAPVTQVSSGVDHTCAVTQNQDVWCWGGNLSGQLGTSAELGLVQRAPRKVVINSMGQTVKFTSVAAGNGHTCALSTTGDPWCWGDNADGQLGRGHTNSSAQDPAPVWAVEMGTVRSLVAGSAHNCAITTGGTLWCWGANDEGRVGDGTTANRSKPVRVAGGSQGFPSEGVAQVAANQYHTCAVTQSRAVYCWGSNSYGRLGNPAGSSSTVPVKVTGHASIQGNAVDFRADTVSVGLEHTCALRESDGMAWCWGRGVFGQLGDGLPSTSQTLPRYPVKQATTLGESTGAFLAVSAGHNHTCSRNAGDRAYCWGMNTLGQLGDTTFVNHKDPAMVLSPLP